MKVRHALLVGIFLSIIYDIIQAFLSYGNNLLFVASMFCIVISIIGIVANLPDEEDLKLKWALMYVIPAGLLVISRILKQHEIENTILTQFGYKSVLSYFGHSSEYENSVKTMFFSFTIPLQVLIINAIYCGTKIIYQKFSQ